MFQEYYEDEQGAFILWPGIFVGLAANILLVGKPLAISPTCCVVCSLATQSR